MAFRTFRTMAFQLASLEPAPGAVTGDTMDSTVTGEGR